MRDGWLRLMGGCDIDHAWDMDAWRPDTGCGGVGCDRPAGALTVAVMCA